MAHISLRVTDAEKKAMENYADFHDKTISDAIKEVFFEKLEEEFDLKVISEFEISEENGDVKYKTFDEIAEQLELKSEIERYI